jgi:hypothetical protein
VSRLLPSFDVWKEFVRLMGSPEIEQLEHSSIHFAQRVLEWFGVDVRGIASQ